MNTPSVEPQRTSEFQKTGGKCMCFNLRKAARVVTQIYDEAMRPTGLRSTQLTLLGATMMCGPLTVNDLAEIVVMDRTTLTRNLKPLEKQGLLKLKIGDDRRERQIVLTDKGRKVMEKARPLVEKTGEKMRQVIGDDRVEQLLKDLNLVLAAVREP